jgi:hypothetical protein
MLPYSISAWMSGLTHVAFGFLTRSVSGKFLKEQESARGHQPRSETSEPAHAAS